MTARPGMRLHSGIRGLRWDWSESKNIYSASLGLSPFVERVMGILFRLADLWPKPSARTLRICGILETDEHE
jgi:hypothetical protein